LKFADVLRARLLSHCCNVPVLMALPGEQVVAPAVVVQDEAWTENTKPLWMKATVWDGLLTGRN